MVGATTWSIACPQAEKGNCVLKSNGQTINWSHLIKNSVRPFWVWKWAIVCSMSIPIDIQNQQKFGIKIHSHYQGKFSWWGNLEIVLLDGLFEQTALQR